MQYFKATTIYAKTQERGAVMMILVIFFIIISTIILLGVTGPTAKELRVAGDSILSKQSYFLAESGVEDAYYRVKNAMNISASETISLAGSTATTTISTSGNQKQITAVGDVSDRERKVSLALDVGAGIAFNYGLQSGEGGVTVGGGSTVNGNIYSNASINAISATINGTAIAADTAAQAADQVNNTPTTPPSAITFRNASASRDFAQSFQVSTTSPVSKFQFYIKKVGSPADATIKIVLDSSGSPSSTVVNTGSTTMTLSAGLVTTNYGWLQVSVPTPPSLIPGTTYWVVVQNGSSNASNYFLIGGNTTGPGVAKTGSFGGSWVTNASTGYVAVYLGGTTAYIGGATYVGGVTIASNGDAWARSVQGVSIAGHLYCQTGSHNSKSCDTSRGIPPAVDLPYSDANIQSWKDEAVAGGTITGNYTVGYAGATLGPKKIVGNLTVNGGGTLTMTGTLWVTGNVVVTGGGKVSLPSNFNQFSGTIVSDGTVTVNGGGSTGSGSSGSYLFLVSTSQCPNAPGCSGANAISVSGGAGAIAVDAQYGTVSISGGATLKAVAANAITITGGSTVNYDSGLASPSFSSGPSGSYTVTSWKESQ